MKRPQSAPTYIFKETNPPSNTKVIPKVSVSYDENGHKVVKRTENATISTILSSMIVFDKTVRDREDHPNKQKTFRIHYPQLLLSELDLPTKNNYVFNEYHHNFLSSSALSLSQMIQSKNRPSGWRESDIPDWICLREQYMSLLEELSKKMLASEKVGLIPDFMKKEMISLLLALRLVTVKIMKAYKSELPNYGFRNNPRTETNENWKRYLDYLSKIPSSLDWLDIEPFRSLCGLHLYCNPFCSVHNLSMELAIVIKDNFSEVLLALQQQKHQFSDDFERDDIDVQVIEPYNGHLVSLIRKELQYTNEEDSLFKEFYADLIFFGKFHDVNLDDIMSTKAAERKMLEAEMEKRCQQVIQVQSWNTRRRCFRGWIIRLKLVKNLKKFVRKRRRRIKRAVLKGFTTNIIRENRLRVLTKRYNINLLVTVVESWKELVIWCKKYRALQTKCIDNWKRDCIYKWRKYIELFTYVAADESNFVEAGATINLKPSKMIGVALNSAMICANSITNTVSTAVSKICLYGTDEKESNLLEWKLDAVPAIPRESLVENHIVMYSCSRDELRSQRDHSIVHKLKNTKVKFSELLARVLMGRHTKLHPS